ncbi:hypothetical protein [Duganella sp. Root1480D1]|uniref:hypothetical protein n=1 Tax=Duganella sp. Root1480D1 TaxID=1736471 RepID=UPI00070DA66B|nr:hypothetical protein [Duganella sp. Root1480D1]KQZ31796.1 hypothetical protein ASD58_29755 [Duganella sp. Root1480D1]
MSRSKNRRFWLVSVLAAVGGIAIAIGEERGIIQGNFVLKVLGFLGAVYFLAGAVIIPYFKLRMLQGGFRLYTPSVTFDIRWECVTEISVFKEDGALEWLIKTTQSDSVFICDDEYLYRNRLRKGAIAHLNGFSDALLQVAVESPSDGAWTCFKVP